MSDKEVKSKEEKLTVQYDVNGQTVYLTPTSSLEEWRFKLIANVAITAIIIVNFVFIGVIFIIV